MVFKFPIKTLLENFLQNLAVLSENIARVLSGRNRTAKVLARGRSKNFHKNFGNG